MAADNLWNCSNCGAPNPQSMKVCFICKTEHVLKPVSDANQVPDDQKENAEASSTEQGEPATASQREGPQRYRRLVDVSRLFCFLAYLWSALGALGFVIGLVITIDRGPQSGGLLILGVSLLSGVMGFAHNILISEGIEVMLDIEEHVRVAAGALREKAQQDEQRKYGNGCVPSL